MGKLIYVDFLARQRVEEPSARNNLVLQNFEYYHKLAADSITQMYNWGAYLMALRGDKVKRQVMKDLKLYPIKPIDGKFVMDENHHMVFIPDQPAQALEVDSPNDLKELRLYRAALMILLRDPNVRCSLVCDGDCIDCMTSASGTPRGFRIRQDLLKEEVGDSVYDV